MNIQNEIEKAFEKYEDFVFEVARREFERVIKPWLAKKHYKFMAGNGDFFVRSKEKYLYEEDMPKYIRDILYMEIPGMSGNDLGSIMPDYEG